MNCSGIDINVTGQSIDEVIAQLDGVIGGWKIRKSLDGCFYDKWVPVEYGVKAWSKLRRCWVFENDLFYWSWNCPSPDPSKVVVVTNTYGPWCEQAVENQSLCSKRAGYSYSRFSFPPPSGTSANWSKFVALKNAMEEAMTAGKEQVIWLDADILFSRQIPFGNLFPSCDICCGWYFPTEFYGAENHGDGIANGCMFSMSVNEENLSSLIECCNTAHRNRYCQSYPFEEVALKEIFLSRKSVYRFEHISITPHSVWRNRENLTGIHHCVSGMHDSRTQAMLDTHRMFLLCDS